MKKRSWTTRRMRKRTRTRSYRTTMKRMRKKPPRMNCRTSLRRKSWS